LFLAIIGLLAARSIPFRRRTYNALAEAPLFGAWLREAEIAKWSLLMTHLLKNRVPIIPALELAQAGLLTEKLRTSLSMASSQLRAGKRLADVLASSLALGPLAVNLIRVGERSGDLASMMAMVAELYGSSSRDRLRRLVTLIEPLAILIIGSVVGFIMIAIMLAITTMSNVTF
jgi:general secretion pathway protein F